MIESKGLSADLGAAIIGAQLGFCHPPFPPFMDQFLRYCTVATQKFALSHFHRRMYAVSTILSAFASKNTERKEEMRAFKLFLPHFLTLQCQNEVLRVAAQASFRKERRCVFYCTLFRFIVPSFTVFLFALGDWRRRNFRFFFLFQNLRQQKK